MDGISYNGMVCNPDGNRNVLYLYRNDDGSWNWNYNLVDNDNWNANNPSGVLATRFVTLPIYGESFVFSVRGVIVTK
ncbi:MAG: hypothetical protein Q8P20_02045 [bacterium]|nr:hypothetical protein [bacterium]